MLSVIFATYNGERTLPRTLEAFARLAPPPGGVEIIAVDNGSTDSTPQLLQNARESCALTLLNQPLRGKNRALNSALPHASGELIVFTDDDVVPDVDWLLQLESSARNQPQADIFGGAIFPVWDLAPPEWMTGAIPQGITFGLTSPDLEEGSIFPGLVWGANMMVRRRIFDAGHRFEESVGPNVGQYMMGSETEFNLRVCRLGHKTWFCPAARVGHIIRDFQMSEDWVIRRAYRFGRNSCFQDFNNLRKNTDKDKETRGLLNFPKWMLRKAATETLRAFIAGITGRKPESVMHKWEAAFLRGYMTQAMHDRRYRTGPSLEAGINKT